MENNNTNGAPSPSSNASAPPPPVPNGIVSVNARGNGASGMLGKIIFVLAIAFVLIIGGVFAFNKFVAAKKAAFTGGHTTEAVNRPAAVGQHRTFDTDPPLPPNAPTDAQKQATSDPSNALCPDGSSGTELLDNNGKPMTLPNGQSVRACKNGRVVTVPQLKSADGTRPVPLSGAQGGQTTGTPAPSRYAGDVIVPPPATTTAQQGSPGANNSNSAALLTALLANRGGVQQTSFAGNGPTGSQAAPSAGGNSTVAQSVAGPSANQQGSIGGLLQGTQTNRVTATTLGDRSMILPMGRLIDCALTVQMISEVSGMASCVLQEDVYSDDGRTILAEKGSEATGEYMAQMAQGQRRLFVLWNRIKTPYGVTVNVASPGADGLGTTGLGGYVDNRWGERIGAALMLSIVQDAIGYETAKASSSNGSPSGVAVFPNSSQTGNSIAQRVLESTINIKPTLYKNQGDRASIYIARDIDFGSVYALRGE